MAQIQLFYLLDQATADDLRARTAGRPIKMDPQQIALGPHAGQWIVSVHAYDDFPDLRPILDQYPTEALDMDTLWPPLDV